MNSISTEQILSQIRTLNAELQTPGTQAMPPADGLGFGELLKNTLDSVNETQKTAQQMTTAFSNGTSDASLVEVMLATQKADLSFRAMTQVRNKLLTAYQEIMNMPV